MATLECVETFGDNPRKVRAQRRPSREIVAFNTAGKPDFHRLGFGRGSKASVAFVAFDVLYLDDELLIDQPYWDRRPVRRDGELRIDQGYGDERQAKGHEPPEQRDHLRLIAGLDEGRVRPIGSLDLHAVKSGCI